MHYSVCIPAVLGDLSVQDAMKAVKASGFTHYEIWSWWDQDMAAYAEAQKREGLSIAALCTPFIPLTDPKRREEYLDGLRRTIGVCREIGCTTVISQVGDQLAGVPRGRQHDSIVEGLLECVPMLKEAGITLVIEPLNTRVDHKGYYLWSAAEAFDIVDEVGSPYVKVLYDMYHQHVMDDLKLGQIISNIDKIGHFHMAGNPGRHEPFVNSEVPYDELMPAIRKSGYVGSVGQEYFPVLPAAEGLKDLNRRRAGL